jgi:hypothetical protein
VRPSLDSEAEFELADLKLDEGADDDLGHTDPRAIAGLVVLGVPLVSGVAIDPAKAET